MNDTNHHSQSSLACNNTTDEEKLRQAKKAEIEKKYKVISILLVCIIIAATTMLVVSFDKCKITGHVWLSATCDAPKTCYTCGKAEGSALGHRWKDATCDAPKTCYTCGKTTGSALGHNWKDATYTAPKTCARCGKTEGEPKGYLENVSGEFQWITLHSWNTYSYVFNESLKGVKSFTLYFNPTFNYNTWVDDWKLLYQDTNGSWHEYGAFTLDTTDYLHEFSFNPELDIKAIATVPRIGGNYSYTFSLGVYDLYYTN